MFSLEQIKAMNADAGIMARGKRLKPFLINDINQIDEMPPFPFPNMGDAVEDIEQEKLDSLFCDSSGWGSPGEPALTTEQLKTELRRLLEENDQGILVAIEEQGQFQLSLGVWKNG